MKMIQSLVMEHVKWRGVIKIIQFRNRNGSNFEVSKRKKHHQKNSPKKVGPLYLLPPLLITSGSEPTLFTTPLLIATPHYKCISFVNSRESSKSVIDRVE